MKEIKLNLGCRNDIRPGWINIDADGIKFLIDETGKDTHFVQMDVMTIDQHFKIDSVDEIISNHLFEHLSHIQISILLYKLWKVMKVGASLKITVPNFQALIQFYTKLQIDSNMFSNLDIFQSRFFGLEEGFHKTFWNPEIGRFYLIREGFFEPPCIIENETELEITFKTKKV